MRWIRWGNKILWILWYGFMSGRGPLIVFHQCNNAPFNPFKKPSSLPLPPSPPPPPPAPKPSYPPPSTHTWNTYQTHTVWSPLHKPHGGQVDPASYPPSLVLYMLPCHHDPAVHRCAPRLEDSAMKLQTDTSWTLSRYICEMLFGAMLKAWEILRWRDISTEKLLGLLLLQNFVVTVHVTTSVCAWE